MDSNKNAVRIAGVGYLLTLIVPTLSAIFIYFKLIVPGNAALTTANILANESLFRVGIASDLIMSFNLIILSMALFTILKTVNKNLALFAALWKLAEGILVGVVTFSGIVSLLLINGKVHSSVLGTEQLHAIAGLILDSRLALFSIIIGFGGIGSTLFCYLFLKSKYIPGLLAAFGVLSYSLHIIHFFVFLLFPNYEVISQAICIPPSILFEIAIGLWLLVKGVNIQQTNYTINF